MTYYAINQSDIITNTTSELYHCIDDFITIEHHFRTVLSELYYII